MNLSKADPNLQCQQQLMSLQRLMNPAKPSPNVNTLVHVCTELHQCQHVSGYYMQSLEHS